METVLDRPGYIKSKECLFMQKCSWFAGLLVLGFSLGCGGSDAKPGGNAPKFEGEVADDAAADSPDAAAADETAMDENATADAADMKDDDVAAVGKPDPFADSADEAPATGSKSAPGGKKAMPKKAASDLATETPPAGIFKGLTNSVLRGARKTMSGSSGPAMSGPPAEPKAEDDPFPNGEPSDKPADKPGKDE
jgi:hypothetical protein